jgi:O-antigen ligase
MAYLAAIYLLRPLLLETIAKLIVVFVGFVIVGAVFSYFELPGFSPQLPPDTSLPAKAAYLLTYNARFSHPFIGLSNNLATVLAFFPFILAACFRITGSSLYLWMLYATLIAILATLSRGVMLALIVTLMVYFFTRSFRFMPLHKFLKFFSILASGFILFIMLNPATLNHFKGRLDARGIHTRLHLYRQTIEALESAPLLGYGAGMKLDFIQGSNGKKF